MQIFEKYLIIHFWWICKRWNSSIVWLLTFCVLFEKYADTPAG